MRSRSTVSKRLCFVVLFVAALGSFASSLDAPSVWLFAIPAVASVFKNWEGIPELLVTTARRILWILLGGILILGWILMAYPVLSANAVTWLSLLIGYGLLFLGGLFLLGESAWPFTRTSIPASVGLFVVASFNPLASLHSFLFVAGGAIFCYLAQGSTNFSREPALGLKLASLLLTGVAVGSIAWAIIRLLPWAQGRIEDAAVQFYVPPNTTATVGNSSYARLGHLQSLKRSKKLVMRVWTDRPRKLRGQVLVAFDGAAWTKAPGKPVALAPDIAEFDLQESLMQWLRELPGNDFQLRRFPGSARISRTKVLRADDGTGPLFTPTGAVLVRASAKELHRDPEGILSLPILSSTRIYGVLHVRQGDLEEPSRELREACLDVPQGLDPRLNELAAELAEGASSPGEMVRRTVDYVGRTCRYSLDVGTFESDQPVAEFLFEKKRGYCQYFASAAALLLRLQGVPTRYVGGFNVTGSSRRADHYVVRESDAHAWIEAYLPGKGWVEADPTPAAEYESLHADLEDGWLKDVVEWVKASMAEWMVRTRLGDWRSMLQVLGRKLRSLIERPLWGLSLLVLLVGAMLGFYRGRWKRHRLLRAQWAEAGEIPEEIADWMARLEKQWKRRGLARPPTRAPLEHARDLPQNEATAKLRRTSLEVIECYYRVRFRGDRVAPEELESLRRVMEGGM